MSLKWRAAGASLGLAERGSFALFERRDAAAAAERARSHVGNNDSFLIDNTGFYIADGMGDRPKAGVAARLAVSSVADYLNQRGARRERPEFVVEMAHIALTIADQQIRLSTEGGGTTFDGLVLTNDPLRPVGMHIGDSTRLHVRSGLVIGRTVAQVDPDVRVNPPLTNALAGFGRLISSDPLEADQVGVLEAEQYDLFVFHTDGVGAGVSSPRILLPTRIAREAWDNRTDLQRAARAVITLPECYVDEARAEAVANQDMRLVFVPKVDDATDIVAQLS